jgi:hypothetical protein
LSRHIFVRIDEFFGKIERNSPAYLRLIFMQVGFNPIIGIDQVILHIYFLASVPKNPDLKMLESIKRDSERFNLMDKIFYLHAPDGVGLSKLAVRAEKSLGVAVTSRNWRSVCKILAIAKKCGR